MAKRHPDKHIEAALKYARSKGWTVTKGGGHAWGRMRCGDGHHDCQYSIWSTPKTPQNHAKFLRRKVDQCPGSGIETGDDDNGEEGS